MKRKNYSRLRLAAAVTVFIGIATAVVGAWDSTWFLSLQAGPAWMRLAAGPVAVDLILIAVLLLATFLSGRIFCAVLCPLGTCQDLIGVARSKKRASVPNLPAVRYGIAVASLVVLAGGWVVVFRGLDPFSRFSAMVAALTGIASTDNETTLPTGMIWGGLIPLILLAVLVVWKKRIYCVTVCPIGTVLGAAAKFGIWRLRMRYTCTGCARCQTVCPTGCIDAKMKSVDAERCVLCLRCVSSCPNGSMAYSTGTGASANFVGEAAVDTSRRTFLISSAAFLAGSVVVGRGLLSRAVHGFARAADGARRHILPPGAGRADRFARLCSGCQVCTASCPTGIIVPSATGFGPVRLDYSRGPCAYDCSRCNSVCPSDALLPVTLVDKQWLKIGEAQVDMPTCRNVRDGIPCDLCAVACPKDAIFMMDVGGGRRAPEVAAFHCIGCGACQAVCPVTPRAVRVTPIEQQLVGF